uniref:Uncharacterized protein n=1 Tax=Stomoxys calcitrans TaxID=35570 RepID=A0A1I8PDC0_STOCA|nr:unnamed protein product [Stomoxys calcitrans]
MKSFVALALCLSLAVCSALPVDKDAKVTLESVDAATSGDAVADDHARVARGYHGFGRGFGGYGGYGGFGGFGGYPGGFGGGYGGFPGGYGGYGGYPGGFGGYGGYPGYGGGFGGASASASASASSFGVWGFIALGPYFIPPLQAVLITFWGPKKVHLLTDFDEI